MNPTSTCTVCGITFEVERAMWRPHRPRKACSAKCRLVLAKESGSRTVRPPGEVTEPFSNEITAPTYWPREAPAAAKVRKAMHLLERGWTTRRVGEEVGLSHHQVERIRDFAWKYDPYVDEVAVERALSGDRSVLPRLTIAERVELRSRLVERYIAEPWEFGQTHWLSTLASSWGADFDRLRNTVSQRASRMAAA